MKPISEMTEAEKILYETNGFLKHINNNWSKDECCLAAWGLLPSFKDTLQGFIKRIEEVLG